MNPRHYALLAAAVFAVIGVAQLGRVMFGWSMTWGDVPIPLWANWLACIVAALLAWLGYMASRS